MRVDHTYFSAPLVDAYLLCLLGMRWIDSRTTVLSANVGNSAINSVTSFRLRILTGESDLLLALEAPVLFLLPRILHPGVVGRGTGRVGGGRGGSRRVRTRAVESRGLEFRLKDKSGLEKVLNLGLISIESPCSLNSACACCPPS